MNNYITDAGTRTGTIGGTLLVLVLQVNINQLLNTVLTAATGALVSFLVAVACKYLGNRYFTKRPIPKQPHKKAP